LYLYSNLYITYVCTIWSVLIIEQEKILVKNKFGINCKTNKIINIPIRGEIYYTMGCFPC
jgi:hypothetical protein